MRGIGIVNMSTDPAIKRDALDQIARAVSTQLLEHFASTWQETGVPVEVYDRPDSVPADYMPMVVFDSADQAGDLGYHGLTPAGSPYARVFWLPVVEAGGSVMNGSLSLSCVISHEALEALADPYCVWWSDRTTTTEDALEVADPVQADAYEIDGVSVSNFVGPRWFRPGAGDGPFDWMRLCTGPGEIRPGGYVIRRHGGTVSNVGFGRLPFWQRMSKMHAASRTRRRGLVLDMIPQDAKNRAWAAARAAIYAVVGVALTLLGQWLAR